MVTKTCFRCSVEKPLEAFHKHPRMKDGRLNKCAACTVADVRAWREKQGKAADRKARYASEIARGKRRVPRTPLTPEQRRLNRLKTVMADTHKRRARVSTPTELDAFAFDEAADLAQRRGAITGYAWHVDHRVPLTHKAACGLHVAANFQVVPASWNLRKHNKTMADFWPIKGY